MILYCSLIGNIIHDADQWTNQHLIFHFQPTAGNLHPHTPPEVPEGGRPRHHQGGDPWGGADRGGWWDRPRRDGAAARPDPLVQRSEPHPDTGTSPRPKDGSHSFFLYFYSYNWCLYSTDDNVAPKCWNHRFSAAEFHSHTLSLKIEWLDLTHQAELSAVRGRLFPCHMQT